MRKRFGFTLAEVLITLAIIGVVAALTIPTLVTNYQQRGWNTSATVFERKLEESLKVMNTQGTLAGYKTTEDFVSELQKHLKITKVCKNNDLMSCFEDKVYWGINKEEVDLANIKISSNFGIKGWETNLVGVQLANGTSALMAYNPKCKSDPYNNQISGTDCLAILYDTSGYATPNTSGKDLRAINVLKLNGVCSFEIGGTCYSSPFIPTPLTKAECEAQKNDLGIDACYDDNDYWAGAVAACGGVDKLSTESQLATIANYLYNTDKAVSEKYLENVKLDSAKSSLIGFTSSAFSLWSAEEFVQNTVFVRGFTSNTTYYVTNSRTNKFLQSICVVD